MKNFTLTISDNRAKISNSIADSGFRVNNQEVVSLSHFSVSMPSWPVPFSRFAMPVNNYRNQNGGIFLPI